MPLEKIKTVNNGASNIGDSQEGPIKTMELLLKRELELTRAREEQGQKLRELDKIAKMLVRRDFELSEVRRIREEELKELERRTGELEDGRKALMNILEDVDEERRKAEQERDKTSAILKNFADGIIVLENGTVSFINEKVKEFLGLKEEEVLGRPLSDLADHKIAGVLVKFLQSKNWSVVRQSFDVIEHLTMEASVVSVMHTEQEIGKMVILHNITRERLIERMKTEFVSIAAHQLRTPLSAVKWILRMILDGDLGPVAEGQRDFLEKTYRSNERMIKLVNDLLNVTRIEEGRFLYNVKPEDIVSLVEKTIAPLREMARRRGLKLEYKKPRAGIPRISIDAEKLSFVIQNLVENAICYTRVGGIKVAVESLKDKGSVLFSVQDTGIGIPKDQQERVFKRFFRSSTAIKTETEGTGLGLFIARNIIEAHGGKIWFKSTEDKGSTFFFTIPVKEKFDTFLKEF